MQANGRLQRWNSKGRGYVHANGRLQQWKHRLTATGLGGTAKGSQQGLVEAAATDLKHLRGFKGLELGKRQA